MIHFEPFWVISKAIQKLDKMTGFDWAQKSWTPQVDIGFLESHLQHTFGDKMISLQDPQFQICFHLFRQPNGKQVETHHFWDFRKL